jgi:hypothetical protein
VEELVLTLLASGSVFRAGRDTPKLLQGLSQRIA